MIGITSYLLISYWFDRALANNAAGQAIIVNRVGDTFFTLFLAILICFWGTGTLDISNINYTFAYENQALGIEVGDKKTILIYAGVLIVLAASGKSAQFLLHTWLPAAMEGPTPVSSLLHAATLVLGGIYLLLSTKGILEASYIALIFASILGTITALFAATTALVQNDIKRIIAYSTCVRQCIYLDHVKCQFDMQCSYLHPTSKLGKRKSLLLKIASLQKGRWIIKPIVLFISQVEVSMTKAILLEPYLPRLSSVGGYLVGNRISELNIFICMWNLLWTNIIEDKIFIHNVESRGSKETSRSKYGTLGLPKVVNNYGSREIIVSRNLLNGYKYSKNLLYQTRVSEYQMSTLTGTSDEVTIVKSDASSKLLKLNKLSLGNKSVIIDNIYKLMYNKDMFLLAYDNLKSRPGNMTLGITPETLDGMSMSVLDEIILSIKDQSFKFKPGRRIQIPKNSEKTRPLTIASPRDKLVQEVMRLILESIFESTFQDSSHGFRPNRSCHTALRKVFTQFGVASWYIEGDISKCFDSIDHDILINIIKSKIKDEKFIRLIRKALNAGYLEFTHEIPQGSIISPILCNIYLNKLDVFIAQYKSKYDKGNIVRVNPQWLSIYNKLTRAKSSYEKLQYRKLLIKVPSKNAMDPNFKRLIYVRYADDWIIGIRGSKEECRQIILDIKEFLITELKLELNLEKTLITNANCDKALFLGTLIRRSRVTKYHKSRTGHLARNSREIRLEAPFPKIKTKLSVAGFLKLDKSWPKFLWLHNRKDQIILLYNAVYREYLNYYSFVHNKGKISSYIHFILKSSCAKLLASKFSLKSQKAVFKKFGSNFKGSDKISFVSPQYLVTPWDFKINKNIKALYYKRSRASREYLSCSVCDSKYRVEMHHIRALKDLNPKLNTLDALLVKRNRKLIPLCRFCHMKHHKITGQ